MAYVFDGPNKLITLTEGTTAFEAQDLYSRWKDWVLLSDNAKWIKGMSTVGGEELTISEVVAPYFFLENGWTIKPQEASHTLVVSGNLLKAGGGTPFVNTTGDFNVRIVTQFSVNSIGVITDGTATDPAEVADAVWSQATAGYNSESTFGGKLKKQPIIVNSSGIVIKS